MVAAFVLWIAVGSGSMSSQTFGWVGAVLIGIVAVTLMSLRAGRPTRSVAHVLHDAEEQKRRADDVGGAFRSSDVGGHPIRDVDRRSADADHCPRSRAR